MAKIPNAGTLQNYTMSPLAIFLIIASHYLSRLAVNVHQCLVAGHMQELVVETTPGRMCTWRPFFFPLKRWDGSGGINIII